MQVLMLDPSAFTPPYDHHLCNGLANRGCDVRLYTTDSDYYRWKGDLSYSVVEYFYEVTGSIYNQRNRKYGRTIVKGLEHIANMASFISEARSIDPDIIHVQWAPLPIVDQWFFQKLSQIAPLVFTVHDTTPFHGSSTSWVQLYGSEKLYSGSDQLIVHTESSKDELVKQGVSREKISIVPHGILEYPQASRQSSELAENENRTILFFGTIKEYKSPSDLIKAYAELPSTTQAITNIKIAGNPKMDIEPLRQEAKELGVMNSMDWDLRYIPDQEVEGLFKEATVVVFPYEDIDQSGVLLTSVQFKTPVIATDIAGFSEILTDGEHGYLIPPNNASALSKALDRILTNPKLANKMGKEIQELSDQIPSWEEIADRTVNVYRNVS